MTLSSTSKTLIFDLGNVVLDWDVERILDSLALEPETRELLHSELFAHQDWLDMDHGKTSEESVMANVCERSELDRGAVEAALLAAKRSLLPITETLSLMQEFSKRGIKMFCLSNMSRETYAHISSHDLFEMFSGIVISGIEGCMKPQQDIFHLTIDRFRLQPARTLFIDDSLANIRTARSLGIEGFHFKRSRNCYAGIRSLMN